MTPTANDIERIVREVLRDMGLAEAPAAPPSAPVAAPSPAQAAACPAGSKNSDAGDGRVRVEAPVVTLEHLPERLDQVRQLVVSARAVVTPAVRDELQRYNVALAFADKAKAAGKARVRLASVSVGKFDPTGLASVLRDPSIEVVPHRLDCLIRSTDWLWEQLQTPDTLGLMLTRHVAAGLCLTNRVAKIRAVTGRDAAEVGAAAEAVGANVLVLSPRGLSPFVLRQTISAFCRNGVRPCPKVFEERLS